MPVNMTQFPNPKIKVDLAAVKQTLLITLFAKAMESQMPDSILGDTHAHDLIQKIDFDFDRLHVNHDEQVSLASRAFGIDQWLKQFIDEHPKCMVVDLGCGLDTRFHRLGMPKHVQWFDVDFPQVIALRKQLFPSYPNTHCIGTSLDDPTWHEQLPNDLPTLIVAEGLFLYLSPAQIKQLLNTLSQHIPNAVMVFDAYNKFGTMLLKYDKSIRATGAKIQSRFTDIQAAMPKTTGASKNSGGSGGRMKRQIYTPSQIKHLSQPTRTLIKIWQQLPIFASIAGLYRFEF